MKRQTNLRIALSAAALLLVQACGVGSSEVVEGEDVLGAADETQVMENAITGSLPIGTTLKTTTGLNLRKGPGTSYGIILTMPGGASVSVVASAPQNGFYKIKYGSTIGWASGSYLVKPTTTSAPKVTITGPSVLAHVQTFANRVCAAVGCPYTIGTRVGHSPTADRALDFMQGPLGVRAPDGGVRGDKLCTYALNNWSANRLMYIIWKQRINSKDGRGWRLMENRGSITANHYDHVHASFNP